jgi:hypothetical protein
MVRDYPNVQTVWAVTIKVGSIEKHYKVTTYPNSALLYLETWRGRAIPEGGATKLMPVIRDAIARAKATLNEPQPTTGATQ